MQWAVVFFTEPGHEAKTRFSLDPVALALKLGDDLVDGLPTDTCLVADLGSCEIPGAARPYGFEHSGYVVSLAPHHPLSRQGSFALDPYKESRSGELVGIGLGLARLCRERCRPHRPQSRCYMAAR